MSETDAERKIRLEVEMALVATKKRQLDIQHARLYSEWYELWAKENT